HADERAGDGIDREDKLVERYIIQRAREGLLQPREEVLPKRPTAADLVLPKAGLRFVDAQRDGAAQGKTEVGGVKPLIVDAVARFVEDAEETLVEFARMVTRGEPAIARTDAAAKRVGGGVESAGVEIEADCRRGRLPE